MNNFIILSILISIFSFLLYNYIESRRQFVFGYGSLIIDESREKTLLMKINMNYGHSQSSKRYESMENLAEIYQLILHFIQ